MFQWKQSSLAALLLVLASGTSSSVQGGSWSSFSSSLSSLAGRGLLRQLDQEGEAGAGGTSQQQQRVRTDLVRLTPFDVKIAMTGPPSNVNIYALTDIVTDWMTESFVAKSENEALLGSNNITFDSLGLEVRTSRRSQLLRNLQDDSSSSSTTTTTTSGGSVSIQLYTANYDGVSLWERRGLTTPPMDAEIVELIQRATFLEDNDLLSMLRAAEPYTGLGETVVDVRVDVATPASDPSDGSDSNNNSDSNLEIIIIIAIVVACLAFGLLMFAVIWAWRTDQTKRETYSHKADRSIPRMDVPTGSDETEFNEHSPTGMSPPAAVDPIHHFHQHPTEILEASSPHNDYPDSVISEDISTSLTAYYRSGMAGYSNTGGTRGSSGPPRELNDAASMSSMDSYGYSLDGYAPSLGPAPQGYPVGPFNGMVKDPDTDYSEDEDGSYAKDAEDL